MVPYFHCSKNNAGCLLFENSGFNFTDRKRNMVSVYAFCFSNHYKILHKSMTFYNKICSSYETTCLRFRDMWQVQKWNIDVSCKSQIRTISMTTYSVFFNKTFAQFIYRINILLFGSWYIILCMRCHVSITVSQADIFRCSKIMLSFDYKITVVCQSQPIDNHCCGPVVLIMTVRHPEQ